MFVYTTGRGVNGFTLDPSVGEFLLSHPYMKIPEKGAIYSINEANYHRWDVRIKKFYRAPQKYQGKTVYL